MTITVVHECGGQDLFTGEPTTETKIFNNRVDFDRFVQRKKEFDAEDEIHSVNFDYRIR